MRILWIVNLLLPQLSQKLGVRNSSSGTWLFEWANKLGERNCQFAVACVYGSEFQKICINGITFYCLPGNGKNMLFYTKKYEKIWKRIIKDFKPDIINIHGTEYSHGLSCMRANPKETYIVSMQGMIGLIQKVDFGGIKRIEFLKNKTKNEWLKFNGVIENHILHVKNTKFEKEMLKRANAIAYVNDFDYSYAQSINSKIPYFNVDYDMQNVFKTSEKWNFNKCNKHTIFTNPGGTPLKGTHQLLKAIAILKNKYSDIKVVVPGMGNGDKIIVNSGYTKYLSKLIKKLNISENVVFLGYQQPSKMCANMLSANVVVIPSAIEGTSLILREAMYLGCPCIVSLRGGMKNYISDGINAFGYEFDDIQTLASKIETVFETKNVSDISKAAIQKTKYYDTDNSFDSLIKMYEALYENKK